MIETLIQLEPRENWRPGMTLEKLKAELDERVRFPGLTNAWVMPIKTRIDMLATGIKTPVGVKIAGPDHEVIQRIGRDVEGVLQGIPGTLSAYSERVVGGRYVTVDIDRLAAARYGLNVADLQEVISAAVGGMNVSESVEGRERYPINLRYPRDVRDSIERLRELPMVTPSGAHIPLGEVATLLVETGPPIIKSENARPNGWTFVDIRDRDLGSYVAEARRAVAAQVELPPGYSIDWSGQYEYLVRAQQRLALVLPVTLAIIVMLLYVSFRNGGDVLTILGNVPLALAGGLWFLYLLDYNLSVAVGVGFIALAGVAVELGMVLLVYLNQALERRRADAAGLSRHTLREAVMEGALLRVRPIVMTVATIFGGLAAVMIGGGTGSEVMRRIAAPMVGGMASTLILTLVVIPAVFLLRHSSGSPRDEG